MSFLPVFLDLSHGRIVLLGAGAAARAKLQLLRSRGANIAWYPMSGTAPQTLAAAVPEGEGRLDILPGEPGAEDFGGAVACIAATGGGADERLAQCARRRGIPVNVVDRPDLSSFIFPAIVDRGDVVVAISTGGASPVLARRLRERIEALLPARLGDLAAFMGRWRKRLRARFGAGANSRGLWEAFIDGPLAGNVLEGRTQQAEDWLAAIDDPGAVCGLQRGCVMLVGAGPGDPDLLTLKALHALADADVVFYDDLVSPEILGRARRDAEKIFVGRRKGRPGEGQDSTNNRLIAAAESGLRVVRLKGGDPFIFGRGGEELEALRAAGIRVSIVPGITAALGCAAEAEIPLTYRREATQITFLTAHRAEEEAIDWSDKIAPATTLAIYMGRSSASAIRDGLIAAGRDPATPAAVLARATLSDSAAVAGLLEDLPALALRAGSGPALLIVGRVVTHSRAWREFLALAAARALETA